MSAAIDGNFDTSLDSDDGTATIAIEGNFDTPPDPGAADPISPENPVPTSNPLPILLKSRHFTPEPGINQTFEAELLASEEAAVRVLIQLYRAPTNAERRLLEQNNVKLLAYIPKNAWFASIPPKNVTRIVALPEVRWVGKIQVEDKLSPRIRNDKFGNWSLNPDGTTSLDVQFFKDVSLDDAVITTEQYGGTVGGRTFSINALSVTVLKENIIALAGESDVQWIEEIAPPTVPTLDGSRAAINVNALYIPPYNLDGTDVTVLVYEDGGLVNETHPDLSGRVIAVNTSKVGYGHATHVGGVVGGNGSLSSGTYRGMAPNVSIISFDKEGAPEGMEEEYNDSIHNYTVDIATNSWGSKNCDFMGKYREGTQLFDEIVGGSLGKPISITFSAGNERQTCGGYGTIGPASSGKNTITVGATNSNDDSMYSRSGWGPVNDGRIKPDVVAPGCEDDLNRNDSIPSKTIWSTVGSAYGGMCGTSSAAPAVAGSIALMLQDYRATHNDSDPLPSTMKAILIHTAKDLNNTGPDYTSGYGRVDVLAAVNLIEADNSPQQRIVEAEIDDLETDTYNISVPAGMPELKVTLVWDDYPGIINADPVLVNDLDLVVTAPDETKYYPWILDPDDPGAPATNGTDDINNVEQVVIASPASGTYDITVNGTNVSEPPQTYSLIFPDVILPAVTITSPSGSTNDTTPELNFTIDERAFTSYSWDDEGNISGCRVCTSLNTTYGESVPVANTSLLLHFNENYTKAYDDSANGNDGILGDGAPVKAPDWVSGRFGLALKFDGDDDYVNVYDDDSIDFDNESNYSFTMMLWVKTSDSAFSGTQYIFDKGGGSGDNYTGYHMSISNESYKLQFMYHQAATVDVLDVSSTGPIYDGEWHHIVAVRNVTADMGYLYIDGILNSSATDNTTDPEDNSGNLYIGARGPTWNNFNGTIDEFHVIARALNLTEIRGIYNKTLPEGSHAVTVYANDTAGNPNSATSSFTVGEAPPTITINSPPNDTTADATPDYDFTTDESADLWYNLDSGTNRTLENDQTEWNGTIYRDMLPADGDNYTQSTADWTAVKKCETVTLSPNSKVGAYSLNCTRSATGNARMDYHTSYDWNENLSAYENVEFWAIADNATETLKYVHLHTGSISNYFRYQQSYEYDLIQLSNTSWTRITIPFSDFFAYGSPDWEDIDNFMVAFINGTAGESIFIDGLRFTGGNLTKGSHEITVYANDTAGNLNSKTRWFTVSGINITSPPNETISDTTPDLNFTVSETANTTYNWDGEGNISGCRSCDSFNTTYGESNGSDANLSLLLHLNEGTGCYAYDSSSHGNNGTRGTDCSDPRLPAWTTGKFGNALDFEESGDLLNVSDDDSLDLNYEDNLTIMAWIKTTPGSTKDTLVNKLKGDYYDGYHLLVGGTGGVLGMIHDAADNWNDFSTGQTTKTVNDSQWHHVAFVINWTGSGKGYIYIDGELNKTSTQNIADRIDSNFTTNAESFEVGGMYDTAYNFSGTIDDLQVIRRALTAAEIEEYYNKTLSVGQHSVTVYATDIDGNQDSATRYFTIG